jgi:hypothetical protein
VAELVPIDYDPFAAEKFANPAVKSALGDIATLPKRAFEASENLRQGGDYDPGPILEAAMLPMGTGAFSGRIRGFAPVEHDPFMTPLKPVDHDPFAAPPGNAKMAQFERLEKKGAPENITRTLTGYYRDADGEVRVWGEQPKMPESKARIETKIERVDVQTSRVEPKAKQPETYLPKLNTHPNAQPEFVRLIEQHHEKLPFEARRILHEGGSQVYVGDKLIDHSPWLAGVQPRGWPKGTSWEMAEGMARAGDVHIARTSLDRFKGIYVPSYRIEGVYNHESGHAFDHYLDRASQKDSFLRAYKRDKDKILFDDEHTADLGYYLQRGVAGPSEAFAEIFAQIVGPSANDHFKLATVFPHADAHLRALMNKGDK